MSFKIVNAMLYFEDGSKKRIYLETETEKIEEEREKIKKQYEAYMVNLTYEENED